MNDNAHDLHLHHSGGGNAPFIMQQASNKLWNEEEEIKRN